MALFDFIAAGTQYSNDAFGTTVPLDAISVNAGELLVFSFKAANTFTLTLADAGFGLTFSTPVYGSTGGTTEQQCTAIVWAVANETGSLSVTATLSASRNYRTGVCARFECGSGYTVTQVDSDSAGGGDTNSNVWSTPALTAAVGDLVVATVGNNASASRRNSTTMTATFTDGATRHNMFYAKVASGTSFTPSGTIGGVTDTYAAAAVSLNAASSGATISSGTPSGTIGTQRRATLGATSTASTGTFYGVISATQSDITGITAAQVYGALYAGGGAATFSGNAAVTDSTPSVEITGLTPATTYYYAVIHRVGTNNSNVVTGSFTTAVATSTASITLRDGAGALLNAQTLNFWTRTGLNTVAVDGGTSGLSVTCDASGVFTFTGLSIDAGAGFLTVQNPSDNTYSANYPVTFVAGV